MLSFKPAWVVALVAALLFCAFSEAIGQIDKPPLSVVPAIQAVNSRTDSIRGKTACNIVEVCARANPDKAYRDFCADDELMKKLIKKCNDYGAGSKS
jgi:hypothetical protein